MEAELRRYRTLPAEIKVLRIRECSIEYKCDTPTTAVQFWFTEVTQAAWYDPDKEALVALLLNSKLKIRNFHLVTLGLLNQTLVHAREVFREACATSVAHVLLMHQHPSGDPTPSADDIRTTREMVEAGKVLGIPLVDHVIVGKTAEHFVSLKQIGLISS
jgi:DNA repair protein RadC